MITSQTSMLVCLKLYKILHSDRPASLQEQRSVYYKKMFFAVSLISTVGLITFFLFHRLLCKVKSYELYKVFKTNLLNFSSLTELSVQRFRSLWISHCVQQHGISLHNNDTRLSQVGFNHKDRRRSNNSRKKWNTKFEKRLKSAADSSQKKIEIFHSLINLLF